MQQRRSVSGLMPRKTEPEGCLAGCTAAPIGALRDPVLQGPLGSCGHTDSSVRAMIKARKWPDKHDLQRVFWQCDYWDMRYSSSLVVQGLCVSAVRLLCVSPHVHVVPPYRGCMEKVSIISEPCVLLTRHCSHLPLPGRAARI